VRPLGSAGGKPAADGAHGVAEIPLRPGLQGKTYNFRAKPVASGNGNETAEDGDTACDSADDE
jgi:hypothetical protein